MLDDKPAKFCINWGHIVYYKVFHFKDLKSYIHQPWANFLSFHLFNEMNFKMNCDMECNFQR